MRFTSTKVRAAITNAMTGACAVTLVACAMQPADESEFDDQSPVIGASLPTPPAPATNTTSNQSFGVGPASPAPSSPTSDGGGIPGTTPAPAPPEAPSTPTQAGNNDPYAIARDFCAQRINQYRATLGKPPLARVPVAEYCTDRQAVSDSQTKTAHGAFSQCNEFAQNECPGWPGALSNVLPSCLDSMWAEGPGGGHYENMASDKYKYVACGFHAAADGSWWAIQNFR